jgi:hypothetical protein
MVNPFCCGSNQIVKLEQAPRVQNWRRFNQPRVRTKQGLVGPSAGNRQTAPFVVVKTQDFLSAYLPDLENGEALSFERMKRMAIPKRNWAGVQFEGSVPTLRDRIVQGALLHVMEPIFERDFAPQSYGFRPGKGYDR